MEKKHGLVILVKQITNEALFSDKIHFCLIWISQEVSFEKTIEELGSNFRKLDNFITEQNVNRHFKYEFLPKKIESQLTNFLVNDL